MSFQAPPDNLRAQAGKTPEQLKTPRTAVAAGVVGAVAIVHVLRVGTWLGGSLFTLYYSYFSDVVVPLAMYFLLCLRDERTPFLRSWRAKAGLVFGVASLTEAMQAFGVPLLGRTFDPLDIVMFSVGVALAVVVDTAVLPRLVPGWSGGTGEPSTRSASRGG